ncbi:MAG: O-antigen ligase family protein [Patescibacteria group bacterium]|nr:O-antigen ligase family protein [Patescibacteria group bacterium]
MLLIYGFAALIGFFWIVKMILTKTIILRKTFLDLPIFIFFLSQIFSTLTSIDVHTSIFGYYGRFNGGLLSIFCYIFLFYAFVSNNVKLYPLLKISVISSLLVVLYAIPGKLGHDITCYLFSGGQINDNSCWDNQVLQFQPHVRAFSTLGQPNWLGAYLVINFFIGVYFLTKLLNEKLNKTRFIFKYLLLVLYLFLNFSFVLFSRSRSAMIALFISFVVFSLGYFFLVKKKFGVFFLTLLSVILIGIFLFKTGIPRVDKYLTFSSFKASLENLLEQKIALPEKSKMERKSVSTQKASKEEKVKTEVTDSGEIRKIVWRGAVELGKRYPLFGTGVETFAYAYEFVRPIGHNYTSEWDFIYNKAHNEFLNYFATTGFFGLISYLIMIIFFVYFSISLIILNQRSLNQRNEFFLKNNLLLTIALLCAYLSILITNFFGFSTTTINLFFYLIPGVLILLGTQNQDLENQKKRKIELFYLFQVSFNFSLSQLFGMSLGLVLLVFIYFYLYNYYTADTLYALGNSYYRSNYPRKYEVAAFYFSRAIKIRREAVYEDKLSSSLGFLSAIAGLQNQASTAAQLINLSQYHNQRAIESSPKNVFFLKTQAKNYFNYYIAENNPQYLMEGIETLRKIRELSPTDPRVPYNLAVFYFELEKNENNSKKKITYRKKALEQLEVSLKLKEDYQDSLELLKKIRD